MALYRTYRPATFAEVVGQEHVTDPLSRALDSGRINHAYLFSGPRGCGKTSSARILARSLNCEQGPTSTPCGVCSSCVALAPGGPGNLDVIELDAASHGGVDDTRELRDRAFYAPSESRYRVFIVDEAHMVTNAGFNALLKIVEEPPEHLIFVFATTEPEKVLSTIRSRTHHYPFRLLAPPVMRGLLENITEREGVTVAPDVFPLVIRAGGGSPRDSLSILDQLLAGAGPDGVTYDRALALLGVTDIALIDAAIDALAAADGSALFATVERVVDAGHDPRRFAVDLLERLRDLILLQAVPDAADRGLVEAPGDQLDRMRAQIERLGPGGLTRFAEIVHDALGEMRGTTSPRLLLEVMCARMLLPAVSADDAAVLQRLERLEAGVAPSATPGAAAGAPAAGPTASAETPATGAVPAASAPPAPPADEPPPKYVRPSQRKAQEDRETPPSTVRPEASTVRPEASTVQADSSEPPTAVRPPEPTRPEPAVPDAAAAGEDPAADELASIRRSSLAATRPAGEATTATGTAEEQAAEPQTVGRSTAREATTATGTGDEQAAEPPTVGQATAGEATTASGTGQDQAAEPRTAGQATAGAAAGAESPSKETARTQPTAPRPTDGAPDDEIPLPDEPADPDDAPPDEPGADTAPPTPEPAPEPEPEPEPAAALQLDAVQKRFQDVRTAVRARSKSLEPMLSAAVVDSVDGDTVVLSHPAEVLVGRLSAPHAAGLIREALREVFGTELDVRTIHQAPGAAGAGSATASAPTSRPAPKKQSYARPSRGRDAATRQAASTPDPDPEPEEPEPPRADDDIPDAERAEMVAEAHRGSPDSRVDPDKLAMELLQNELGARPLE
ncbi:hypothetical protein GCM10009624_28800 [Gordonia sinesedis]